MSSFILVLSSFFMGLSQQPWGLGFLAWFSLVPILFFLEKKYLIKKVLVYSFLWGFIYHLTFLYWLSSNIGIDSILLRFGTMLLVASFLSLNIITIAIIYFFLRKYFSHKHLMYALPFLIVSIEYLRSFGLYGFTWNSFAYSQIDYLLLSQNIEYTGMYGITFWIVLINVAIYNLIKFFSNQNLIKLVILFLLPWISGFIIKNNQINFSSSLKVKLVQPNIHLDDKRFKKHQSLETLISLSESKNISDLIIWPETSISNHFIVKGVYNNTISNRMNNFLKNGNFSLVAGLEISDNNKKYNSSVLFESDSVINSYYKKRLVPNVEYTPSIFNKLGLNIGLMSFSFGEKLSMFTTKNINFPAMICIESIFPHPTRHFVKNGAGFIVYIVNDGWYEQNPEPEQHARRCVYRAIENRRFVLRCANTGVSMIIDPYGNIVDRLELNSKGIIEKEISISNKKTFYTKYGNVFSILNLFVLILMIGFGFFKQFFGKK